MAPFFTIIIPTYNSSATLKESLDSVLQQSFRDFEILLMDGVSKDDTVAVAASYHDERIHIHSEPDKGIYDAMNKGLKKASGQWIYFLGSDDRLYDAEVLNDVFQKIRTVKEKVAYGNVKIEGTVDWAKGGSVYGGKFNLYKLLRRNICHQSLFYRTEFIKKHRLEYNPEYPVSSDWDFNLKCRMHTDFFFIDRIIAVFNGGGLSSSEKNADSFRDRIPVLYQKYWEVPYMNPVVRLFYKGFRLLKRD